MGARVLIVEDEQIVAADLEGKLQGMGHEVVGIAASGSEAVQMADQEKPEVVLMDIQLQGQINGIEAAKRIQRNIGAPVIFVTAFAGVFVREPHQMQPPGLCLSKPFSENQLQTALDVVLNAPAKE